jgi:SAM-dependent methyltransferase
MNMHVRLAAAVVCFALSSWGIATVSSHQATTEAARERWNNEFAGPLPNLNRSANALLVSVIKGRPPGRALDLGVGEGRNAIYLSRNGWSVTGVDLSEVAVSKARQNAAANKAQLELHVADLDAFDFGIVSGISSLRPTCMAGKIAQKPISQLGSMTPENRAVCW